MLQGSVLPRNSSVSTRQDRRRGSEGVERIWDRKKHYILLWLCHHLNSPPRCETLELHSWLLHLYWFSSRLKELIVPKMPSLINCKFRACFARVTVTFSSILNPVAFRTSCAASLVMVQSGTVCHYSAVTNFCGSFCLDGHIIAEQCDSLKHLGPKGIFFKKNLLWTFNLLAVENADANRNFVSLMSSWSKGCSFGSSGLGISES